MLKKGMYYICSPLSASTKEEIQKDESQLEDERTKQETMVSTLSRVQKSIVRDSFTPKTCVPFLYS